MLVITQIKKKCKNRDYNVESRKRITGDMLFDSVSF